MQKSTTIRDSSLSLSAATQVRAVVRRAKGQILATEWYPVGSGDIIDAMIRLLPRNGEKFMVIWEGRDDRVRRA